MNAKIRGASVDQGTQGGKNAGGASGGVGSVAIGEYPERPNQPECQYYMKTGTCKFGPTCKFNHPKDKGGSPGQPALSAQGLPVRPSEKECAYYIRTGTCKYGVTCKFHHPPQALGSSPGLAAMPSAFQGMHNPPTGGAGIAGMPWPAGFMPRMNAASPGLPFVLPPRGMLPLQQAWPPFAPMGYPQQGDGQSQLGTSIVFTSGPQQVQSGGSGGHGMLSHGGGSGMPGGGGSGMLGGKDSLFPERIGMPECQYYMKTGDCKFGSTCRFHHPKNRSMPSPTCVLSAMGLPLRPGTASCAFYSRYGICKFGPTCKFDHPLPGELSYSPSASSLADMPVAPIPIPFSASQGPSGPGSGLPQQPPPVRAAGLLELEPPPVNHPVLPPAHVLPGFTGTGRATIERNMPQK